MKNVFQIPKEGIEGLKKWGKSDLFAASIVLMTSLPFCLATTFASHLPITAGVLIAVVGGLGLSLWGGSYLTIKMPTLALAPIFLVGVDFLGSGYLDTGYRHIFALLCIAGVLQIFIGITKFGDILSIIPEAIIYGLMSTVGIIVGVRQLYFLIGVTPNSEVFWVQLIEFPFQLIHIEWRVLILGIVSLSVMFLFTKLRYRSIPIIPTSFIVLVLGIGLGILLQIKDTVESLRYISLPTHWDELFFFPPMFDKVFTWEAINWLLVMALLPSLQTILNLKAIDAMDFYRRKSNINRELIMIGLGNMVGGLISAMPMIASMEHGSVGLNSGGKTRWMSFFHALLLIPVFMIIFPFLSYIPLVSLSTILIYYCYKLCSPKLLMDIFRIGKDQFFIFGVTLFTSLIGGFLVGLLVGIVSSWLVYRWLGADFKHLFSCQTKIVDYGNNRKKITLRSVALASNYLSLRKQINELPKDTHIYLDFTKSQVIDYAFLELVHQHPYNYLNSEGSIELQGLEEHLCLSKHPLSTRRIDTSKGKNHTVVEKSSLSSERHLDVQAIAAVNNSKFRQNLTYDGHKLLGFSFALGYEIKYRENKFNKNFKATAHPQPIKIEFSDVFLSKGIRMSEQSYHLSTVLIYQIPTYIPNFILRKESFLLNMIQNLNYVDVVLESYPDFSAFYTLKATDVEEVKIFFTPEMVRFFEENKEFNVESSDNKILIHRDLQLMSRIEMEDCIDFAEHLLWLIYPD